MSQLEYPTIGAFVLKHYLKLWGEPVRLATYPLTEAAGQISVAEFHMGATATEPAWWVYATVGLCAYPMTMDEPDTTRAGQRRIEIIAYADEQSQDIEELVVALATYPFRNKTFLDIGHLVPGTEGVVPGSPLTEILFSPAFYVAAADRTLHLEGGQHVDILWAVPIYPAERQFARSNDWRELVKLLADEGVEPMNFQRPPVV